MPPDESEIVALLHAWQHGEVDELHVLEMAERMEEAWGVRDLPEDDPRSPTFEVLCQLEILYLQLLTPEDVPAMLTFMRLGRVDLQGAWTGWHSYMGSVDWEARRLRLSAHPFYGTHPVPPKPGRPEG